MKLAAVLSISALALASPTSLPDNEAANIPISQDRHDSVTRDDGSVDEENFLSALKSSVLKYKSDAVLGDVLQNIGIDLKKRGNVQLTDVSQAGEDALYYGPGSVSGQNFKFNFDTGSSDTFIPGPKCGRAQGCDGNVKYDQSGQDRHTTTTVTYGSGQVTGEDYFDSVTVGGLTATKQNIISLTKAAGFNGTGSDSLMGMGFQAIAASKQTPFFFNLIAQGKCAAREFAFFLGRKQSSTAALSQMTMCGRNTAKFTGPVTNVPVTKQGYWQVAVQGVSVNGGRALPTTAGQAAIDTGTTLVIAPSVAATSIFAQIPGSIPIPMGGVPPITAFAYPCSSNPKVSIGLANKQFAINPIDFNFGKVSQGGGILGGILGGLVGNLCVAGIAGADLNPGQNFYVVGDVFLKNWYSIYHYNGPASAYVGLAKAKGNQ